MVPLTLKVMVSVPVPAAHPFTATRVLAAVIASRRAQSPAEPGSAVVLTIIGSAPSGARGPSRATPATAISPKTAAISKRTFAAWKLDPIVDSPPKTVPLSLRLNPFDPAGPKEQLASTFVHCQRGCRNDYHAGPSCPAAHRPATAMLTAPSISYSDRLLLVSA